MNRTRKSFESLIVTKFHRIVYVMPIPLTVYSMKNN